jgi:hypothetical protein
MFEPGSRPIEMIIERGIEICRRSCLSADFSAPAEAVDQLKAPWSDRFALQAATSASLLGWRGLPIHLSIATASDVHAPIGAGRRVATAIVVAGEERDPVPLRASRALPNASLTWRLAHP